MTPGTKLRPYKIVAAIGAGGMGEVWKGRDQRLNRIVAIKFSNERFSELFENWRSPLHDQPLTALVEYLCHAGHEPVATDASEKAHAHITCG
jgi:hypothetical protein